MDVSINPTRSFGPSLVAAMSSIPGTYQHQQYMFWFGPMIGAALAAVIYGSSSFFTVLILISFVEYGSLKPNKRDGAGDLDQAVFMSDVARKKEDQEQFHDDEENVQVAQVH